MQEDKSKVLSKTVSEIIDSARRDSNITYTLFCYENNIKTSTYDRIIKGETQSSLYNIAKVVKALGWNFQKFGEELDKRLPREFWDDED